MYKKPSSHNKEEDKEQIEPEDKDEVDAAQPVQNSINENLMDIEIHCELMELHLNSYLLFRVSIFHNQGRHFQSKMTVA